MGRPPGGYWQPFPQLGGGIGRGTGTKDACDKNPEWQELMLLVYIKDGHSQFWT